MWLDDPWRKSSVVLALNRVPFAGFAVLWFVGVVRNRSGAAEDRFFATVNLGAGLLSSPCPSSLGRWQAA